MAKMVKVEFNMTSFRMYFDFNTYTNLSEETKQLLKKHFSFDRDGKCWDQKYEFHERLDEPTAAKRFAQIVRAVVKILKAAGSLELVDQEPKPGPHDEIKKEKLEVIAVDMRYATSFRMWRKDFTEEEWAKTVDAINNLVAELKVFPGAHVDERIYRLNCVVGEAELR